MKTPTSRITASRVVGAVVGSILLACGRGSIGDPSSDQPPPEFGPPGAPPFDAPFGPIPPPTQEGGFVLGSSISPDAGAPDGGSSGSGCATILGIVRDFKQYDAGLGHPDFERYTGAGPRKGIVMSTLDTNHKPVYDTASASAPPTVTTGRASFDQWYNNVDAVNVGYYLNLFMVPSADSGGTYVFKANPFFPLDWKGWGNQNHPHNFHFTTEVHTEFVYQQGQTFRFSGDDDLWVFVNNRLALDLGGPHPRAEGTIDLSTLGPTYNLVSGQTYPLELFHAERHTNESTFEIETNITFIRCNVLVPDAPR